MLKEPLFKIVSIVHEDGQINAELQIDQHNEIFAGHFPDQPVVPGACMLQLVKEVLSGSLNANYSLVRADNIKFLSLVEPAAAPLQLNIAYQQVDNDLKVSASLSTGVNTSMKLQGLFKAK